MKDKEKICLGFYLDPLVITKLFDFLIPFVNSIFSIKKKEDNKDTEWNEKKI